MMSTDSSPFAEACPDAPLPDVLAGPLLRRVAPERLVLWLVGTRALPLELELTPADGSEARRLVLDETHCRCLPVGRYAVVHLIDIPLETPLPEDVRIDYDLVIRDAPAGARGIADWASHLCYDGAALPGFVIASRIGQLLHGSCRKPHHPGGDGLVRADAWLGERWTETHERPAWLLMTGDQIYADDVAGPMLAAIHALIGRLGLVDETLEGAEVKDSGELYASPKGYYAREALLPDVYNSEALRERFFGGVRKPIFTTANARNHLITFSEMLAMYLLAWSPVPWRLIAPAAPPLDADCRDQYDQEATVIEDFVTGLPAAARVMANVPTLMIFDDHDVTDDWNLTAAWEETAYGHPFSRRIIGNALLAYLLCQGWGNDPDRLAVPVEELAGLLTETTQASQVPQATSSAGGGWLEAEAQDATIARLLRFEGWEVIVPGTPKLIMLDTRTRRWRSEVRRHRPSGLMDWEALSELQQELLDEASVLIVSPAPMFGVKLIEAVQKLFALAGKPLLVDAENWMAHRGAASVMLNIFRHSRTPGNYVILSGDVHYSFAYDIEVRHRRQGPRLWQITSSGLKNTFPDTLLDWFDRLNRWLYAPRSPLNRLTQRRALRIRPRDPDRARAGERLWNGAGIGLVCLDDRGRPREVRQLDARGFDVRFPPRDDPPRDER
ncbi:alkaline phosphatase D family protein [Halomonas sp. YLGW01]|uniref:alkaline phosphatase D family protein n=1 Tax=Halomonas sp. YLGW01 TaxID=2773308 RepID=UPI001F5B844B|nr:alkaline phosphatase D family protein [Halomonas sp. YLGW01]